MTKKDSGSGSPVIFTQCTGNIIAIIAVNALDTVQGNAEFEYENYNIINEIVYGAHTIVWGANTTIYNDYRDDPILTANFKALFNNYDNYDYRLASNSMAIDYGNSTYAPNSDILGNPRDAQPGAELIIPGPHREERNR